MCIHFFILTDRDFFFTDCETDVTSLPVACLFRCDCKLLSVIIWAVTFGKVGVREKKQDQRIYSL